MNNEGMLPIDAINEYYRLKDTYESEYYNKYINPIIKSSVSKKEKRTNFSKLPKNECINCKRNVGTVFSVKTDFETNVKKYMAKCGDLNDPCPLDIQILYSVRESMNKTIIEGMKEIEQIKLNIIKEKNNAIFFNKNVVENFEKITEQLKNETQNIGFMLETNLIRNNNPEKYALLTKSINDFGTSFIMPFKQNIEKYNETQDTAWLNGAIDFYIKEMIPRLKEIQALKYDVNMVEYNLASDTYHLIQLPVSVENNEFFITTDDKIVKIIRGVKNTKTKKNISVKTNSKTRKNTV